MRSAGGRGAPVGELGVIHRHQGRADARTWQVQVTHPRYLGLFNPAVTSEPAVLHRAAAQRDRGGKELTNVRGHQPLTGGKRMANNAWMNTLDEIESAIERLPAPQVAELAAWLEHFRLQRRIEPSGEAWLERARGAARPGVTTERVMALTRGEE
jgi:hypothetical protein